MKAEHLFSFLIAIMLVGCVLGLPESETLAPPTTLSPLQSITFTLTPSSLLRTPTILPDARMEVNCLDILPTLPPNFKSEGILVLEDEYSSGVFLKDMKTGALEDLLSSQNLHPHDIFISPNRQWLAYHAYHWEDNQYYIDGFVIAKNDGSLYKVIDDIRYHVLSGCS